MDLSVAKQLSGEIRDYLSPFCDRIQVVGSIRREKDFPRDIDILVIPANQGKLAVTLQNLGAPMAHAGPKMVQRRYRGVQVDVYIATPKTWAPLLLIRTGSKEHNIRLTTLAKRKGWHLYADGWGLVDADGNRIAGDSEESFFGALGIPYLEPHERG